MSNKDVELERCEVCTRMAPAVCIAPLQMGDDTKEMCPVCALHASNGYLGIERERFNGEVAEALRQMCLAYYQETEQEA